MIVPPRLVAGWLLGCASAVCLFAGTRDATAQTRLGRAGSQGVGTSASDAGQFEGQGATGAFPRTYPGNRGFLSSNGGRGVPRASSGGTAYLPRHLRGTNAALQDSLPEMIESPPEIVDEGESVPEGALLVEGEGGDAVFNHLPGEEACCEDGSCGGPGCQSGACFDCCCCFCLPCIGAPHNFSVYGGVHGFKGPINRGSDSSFGFDEAFNWGVPFGLLGNGAGMGAQLGVRGAQSNFSGATGLTLESRNQVFVTTGLFRRVDCGLQWGGVIDYLHEEWDVSLDLAQVRGELSWMFVTQSEVGFRYTGGVTDDDADEIANLVGVDWAPTDTYALFFRQKLAPLDGECQFYAGVSDRSEGLLGASAVVPLAEHLSISAEFAYLVPEVGAAAVPIGGALEESWNAGVGLVFYPDPGFFNPANYYRPLFDVANNGTFMYDLD